MSVIRSIIPYISYLWVLIVALLTTLRERLKILAKKIEPKVYEYSFLNIKLITL